MCLSVYVVVCVFPDRRCGCVVCLVCTVQLTASMCSPVSPRDSGRQIYMIAKKLFDDADENLSGRLDVEVSGWEHWGAEWVGALRNVSQ